ncbi:hypothetical protein FB451DRAFT_1406815 [Mycena latifolia]|nr:hypothetical protein FB451DRAFT_1406815 [Mycena latifolia]
MDSKSEGLIAVDFYKAYAFTTPTLPIPPPLNSSDYYALKSLMNILSIAFFGSALDFIGMGNAAPCEFNVPYLALETGGQGCKYIPEGCRGLPEQLFDRCLQTFTIQLD